MFRRKISAPIASPTAAAFTLIELLVVLAIIAVLTALVSGVVGSTMQKGREAQCASNLRQLGAGALAYAADNDNHMMPHAIFDSTINANREWCYGYGFANPEQAFKEGILGPYLQEAQKVLMDPTFKYKGAPMDMNGPLGARPTTFGFGYNGFFLSRKLTTYGQWEGYPLVSVEKQAQTVMFATSGETVGKEVRPYENIWPRTRLAKRVIRAMDGKSGMVCWVSGHVSREKLIQLQDYSGVKLGHIEGPEGENLFDRFDGDTGDKK